MTSYEFADESSGNPYLSQAAAVLLVASGLIELFSIFGISAGVTMVFPHPLNKILALGFLLLCITGSYYLHRRSALGAYLGISATMFMIVLGILSVMNQTGWVIGTATIAVGSIVLTSLFMTTSSRTRFGKEQSFLLETPKQPVRSSDVEVQFAVETHDVEKKYFLGNNVVQAINGITMKIQNGEFVAIMGPSGSGKSTLLNLLGALDKPSAGQVLIGGVDISMLDEDGLARLRNEKIGFVFQAYNLIARSTVMRNMELPAFVKGYSKEERLEIVKHLLSRVGLDDKQTRKPNTLSGGEQQRVAIARALMNSPEILLADEPTGNVDSKQGLLIMSFLRKLNLEKGVTIIVVTHDIEVAKTADRIVFIRDGRIASEEVDIAQ